MLLANDGEARGLLHVHLVGELPVEECGLHVEMMNVLALHRCQSEQ